MEQNTKVSYFWWNAPKWVWHPRISRYKHWNSWWKRKIYWISFVCHAFELELSSKYPNIIWKFWGTFWVPLTDLVLQNLEISSHNDTKFTLNIKMKNKKSIISSFCVTRLTGNCFVGIRIILRRFYGYFLVCMPRLWAEKVEKPWKTVPQWGMLIPYIFRR